MEYYNALVSILTQYHNIDELDYLVTPYTDDDIQASAITTPPVITHCNGHIVLAEHTKLGITYECVPTLYAYAKQQYMQHADTRDVSTKILLLINSDVSTYYNHRCATLAALVQHHDTSLTNKLCSELQYTALLLSKHLKSGETWSYRRHVLSQLLQHCTQYTDTHLAQLIHAECSVCHTAAVRHMHNYYAWSHRLWVFTTFVKHYRQRHEWVQQALLDELQTVREFNDTNVSEHNAWHYRCQIIQLYLTICTGHGDDIFVWLNRLYRPATPIPSLRVQQIYRPPDTAANGSTADCIGCQLIDNEVEYACRMLNQNGKHQSVWYHCRTLSLIQLVCTMQHHPANDNKRIVPPSHDILKGHVTDGELGSMANQFNNAYVRCVNLMADRVRQQSALVN